MNRPWLTLPSVQQAEYEDQEKLESVLTTIKGYPGFVSHAELNELKSLITEASNGGQFILQIGDCAEAYADCVPETIQQKLQVYNGYKLLIQDLIQKPVTLIARIAGQFSKPRSEAFETINGVQVPSYRGDLINDVSPSNRKADPDRLVQGYQCISAVYTELNAFPSKIFTSHECLHIKFEDSLTRESPLGLLNVSGHFLWLGERTRKPGSGHVELMSSVSNPLGVKVGPNANLADLVSIIKKLNPSNEQGKIVLILRLGVNNIRAQLPNILQTIKQEALHVAYFVDPVHANTYKSSNGFKTRNLDTLVSEVITVLEVLRENSVQLAGLHLESAFKEVTECIGLGVEEEHLPSKYETLCDPRLNVVQTQFLLRELGNKISG